MGERAREHALEGEVGEKEASRQRGGPFCSQPGCQAYWGWGEGARVAGTEINQVWGLSYSSS